MRETNEYAIEWVLGDTVATATVPESTALNNKLKRLSEKYPDKVKVINSELFHIPSTWVKVNPPRQMSDEQKEELRERIKQIREQK